ncbi:hypothetical protein [Liquorilactobacillus satsumensis]|uniref:Polymerase n=1 Tax=Liquorilactobacillus satsumensis DSM 16230 = JCM 12392 TaxID=1423801 RepID=A0A0R1UZ67_9LACO|nr:hypothetical protein [Liquorilactobacillus satsumensis]KRL98486.1 hypothetical protein FD50_GL000800 [Liquorilactobacillus satsumensis DSM 16230 = JCM 12392]MCC7666032.1 beta-carotene 15,15'-monooxygenase [Liquorilactobacillus satsumensis]MCP9313066.1 beta-carotene 15,15'-monooxygenase [Liquorilactobacillus satsumensis]MCP9329361.1 beta-carotene 15,15'-monooxygenase [Liquorilactobacillus satsumensis]MCP9356863.1 beta-carotene 15,15'-monooxygenase [Liquorilactobacillus satsumensis]
MSNIIKRKLDAQVNGLSALQQSSFSEQLYLFSFVVYLLASFVTSTMFGQLSTLVGPIAYYIIEFSAVLVIAKVAVFDGWEREKLIIFALVGIIFWQICKNSGELFYFYYYLFILGAKDVRFERIIKTFLVTIGSFLLVTIAASLLGVIDNLTYGRYMEATIRYALGTIYPTDLAARAFYLLLAYAMLRRFHFKLVEYVSCLAITIFIYAVTDTRLDFYLMLLILLIALFYKYVVRLLEYLGSKLTAVILALFVFINIFLAYTFIPNNRFFEIANKVLSGRLTYGHLAFQNYNIPFFGQYVYQMGNGGVHKTPFQYFYIDSSFIRVLMMEGLLTFLALVGLLLLINHRFFKAHAYSLVIGMTLMILSSVIDQHLLELAFNVVFLGALADLSYWKQPFGLKTKSQLQA